MRNFHRLQNFRILRKFAGPLFFSLGLPAAANPLFHVPTINFPIYLFQPFNRHLRPLIGHDLSSPHSPPPPPPTPPSTPFFSFSGLSMVNTRGGSAFWPWVRRSSLPPAGSSSPAPPAAAEPATAPPCRRQGSAFVGSSIIAYAPRRYDTRVAPPHPLCHIQGNPRGPHHLRGHGPRA